ncbi:D-alanine--D-alanine ligase family protein [Bifidobacterium sp.]|jgi:D-alanine-D-alanine ligase|uniref:D-alanine--D-alanine ligase family protein n=1 Tax=Bifidobacterium sp. TaxID=41200 RepID=UPI0025B7D019|nr:D-alanine--D-alanine ligase family protein [Bifidobacterium sp.]MCH4208939.1 D-alanine--D-alanine ligase [Bifidobacterium sp.]MCI1225530.1 D-alanine--D-alanine ligase [Bifidobacterium sp.]
MGKQRIVLLYGGKSDEHSISCISAACVLDALDEERFEAVPIGITKSGDWLVGGTDPRDFDLADEPLPVVREGNGMRRVVLDLGRGCDGFFVADSVVASASGSGPRSALHSLGHIDAVLPVLHGPHGEDGTVQGLLDLLGVPYAGCGVFASSACMDKHFTKILLKAAGIPVTPSITVDTRRIHQAAAMGEAAIRAAFETAAGEYLARVRSAGLRYPLFVKPSRAGSSFGVSKVECEGDAAELGAAVREAAEHDWKVLIEQGMDGREIECAVLAPHVGGAPQASWPGEIVLDRRGSSGGQFYDFDSKYLDSGASHVQVPADLPEATLRRVQEIAVAAFAAVDGAGLCRVDTFVGADGGVVVNEINTIPGFTPISMYPKAWEASGVSYGELITALIERALEERAPSGAE